MIEKPLIFVATRSLKIQRYLLEFKLFKNWTGEKRFRVRKSKSSVHHFFSCVTFNELFDIVLRNNLFISFNILFISKHPLKERKCKFKLDKITYSKSWCRTTYYVARNMSSMYPWRGISLFYKNFDYVWLYFLKKKI